MNYFEFQIKIILLHFWNQCEKVTFYFQAGNIELEKVTKLRNVLRPFREPLGKFRVGIGLKFSFLCTQPFNCKMPLSDAKSLLNSGSMFIAQCQTLGGSLYRKNCDGMGSVHIELLWLVSNLIAALTIPFLIGLIFYFFPCILLCI